MRPLPGSATSSGPIQMVSASRSARSPALPTAITMRPQLASSAARAVFTSGELAMDKAMRFAAVSSLGTGHRDGHELGGALAVAHDLVGEIEQDGVERGAKRREARRVDDPGVSTVGPRGEREHRVAGRGVGVDGDAVEAAFDRCGQGTPAARRARRPRSVKTNASIVAMSGAIMPLPLAMPTTTASVPSMAATGSLGEGVGGADGVRSGLPCVGTRCRCQAGDERREGRRRARRVGQGLADHAGGGEVDLVGRRRPGCDATVSAVSCGGGVAGPAGEGVGVAGVADDGARPSRSAGCVGTSRRAPTGTATG